MKFATKLPCPVCGEVMPERTSKKEKPYFLCELCGIQIFFRWARGIDRLRRRFTVEVKEDE